MGYIGAHGVAALHKHKYNGSGRLYNLESLCLLLSWVPVLNEITTYKAVLFLMIAFAVLPTLTFNVSNVHKVVQARKASMLLALAMLYPLVILLGGVLAWYGLLVTPADIMGNYPHLVVVGSGVAFGYLVGRLVLAHLRDEPKGLKTGMCMRHSIFTLQHQSFTRSQQPRESIVLGENGDNIEGSLNYSDVNFRFSFQTR